MPWRLHVRLWRWMARSAVREFPWALGALGRDRDRCPRGRPAPWTRPPARSWLAHSVGVELGLARFAVQALRTAETMREALADLEAEPGDDRSRFPFSHMIFPLLMLWPPRSSPPARCRVRPLRPPSPAARRLHAEGRALGAAPRRDPGPRRRLDRRQPRRAGHPAAQPPRRQRLGRLQRRLPAEPARDLPRPHRRRQARDRLGPRARARVRGRPRLHLHHRWLGRRSPHGARGADGQRPRLPAGLRGRRHVGRGRGSVLRRLRPDRRRRRLLPGAA